MLEAKIVMQPGRSVLVDDEDAARFALFRACDLARRLRRFLEIALGVILFEAGQMMSSGGLALRRGGFRLGAFGRRR